MCSVARDGYLPRATLTAPQSSNGDRDLFGRVDKELPEHGHAYAALGDVRDQTCYAETLKRLLGK